MGVDGEAELHGEGNLGEYAEDDDQDKLMNELENMINFDDDGEPLDD